MKDTTLFQYCQKIVVLRNDDTEVLLARRQGEADYDQTYAFIGGKMETTDNSILAGLRREKTEEVGKGVQLSICPYISYNVLYIKQSGQHMILPHYYAEYQGGEIVLSDEYDDFQWVSLGDLESFTPRVENIPEMVEWAKRLKSITKPQDFVTI